jgi:hypothetical protein
MSFSAKYQTPIPSSEKLVGCDSLLVPHLVRGGATRRKFTLEFRTEAAHRVIDTGRSVREVARELSVLEN